MVCKDAWNMVYRLLRVLQTSSRASRALATSVNKSSSCFSLWPSSSWAKCAPSPAISASIARSACPLLNPVRVIHVRDGCHLFLDFLGYVYQIASPGGHDNVHYQQ